MSDVPRLLLIDGNNACHRIYWSMKRQNQNLSYQGRAVNVIYGFFRQLVTLHKDFPDCHRIIVWDKGYARRLAESLKAVEEGIIPSAYKQTRYTEDNAEDRENVHIQMQQVKEGLEFVRCTQAQVEGFEADDIINSYIQSYRKFGWQFVIVSSDKDFFQLLEDDVVIYDAMKKETHTREKFTMETGFHPSLWLEAGALMGEKGDNIHGVDGWGPVNACKYVVEYGDVESIILAIQAKSKINKKEEVLLASIPKLRLARSLKAMDMVPNIPKPKCMPKDAAVLEKYFLTWGFASLLKEIPRLI
jgi:DNA polymerase-1